MQSTVLMDCSRSWGSPSSGVPVCHRGRIICKNIYIYIQIWNLLYVWSKHNVMWIKVKVPFRSLFKAMLWSRISLNPRPWNEPLCVAPLHEVILQTCFMFRFMCQNEIRCIGLLDLDGKSCIFSGFCRGALEHVQQRVTALAIFSHTRADLRLGLTDKSPLNVLFYKQRQKKCDVFFTTA